MFSSGILCPLQQCLPFTVLKQDNIAAEYGSDHGKLQQCLPFTVLKLIRLLSSSKFSTVATVLTVYGIETEADAIIDSINNSGLQQCLPFTVLKLRNTDKFKDKNEHPVATVLTVYGIETRKRTPCC